MLRRARPVACGGHRRRWPGGAARSGPSSATAARSCSPRPGWPRPRSSPCSPPRVVEVAVRDEFGTVTVVGRGLDRRPDVAARALLALERDGIDPHLVTTAPRLRVLPDPGPRVSARGPAAARPVRPARRGDDRRPRPRGGRRPVSPLATRPSPACATRGWSDARRGADQHLRWRPGERLEHLFEQRCERTPDRLGVDAPGAALTYAEVDARANQLARHLLVRGIGPGDRVALLFDDPVQAYVAMLAVLKAGAAYVPLDPGVPGRPHRLHRRRTPRRRPCCRCRTCATCLAQVRAPVVAVDDLAAAASAAESRARVTDGRARAGARRARLHHLHLRLHRAAEGRGGRARQHRATSSGWPPRCTATGRTTACTRA